ncbi:hypothetical protein JL721_4816 [Aureococcus anophagefferens]|nr:hypothetical protein JL721_4816 [Aureococcus anophagefferens]
MPGSGGAFDVEVQWLGDDEDPLDDELLERLTSSVHSGRTVQSFAEALFEKHGAKLNLSGDAQSLSDTIVAYRESLDIDDDEEAAPVELDDVVAESSLLTFRPRVPDADAVLFVAYALAEKGAVKIHLLREMSVAEIAPGTCGELATTLAPGRAHDPRDLDFFAASEYSARAEDRGSIHTSLGSDYKAGLDRYVRVDGSAKPIPAMYLTDLQAVLLDLEADGYLTAYSELETREGGRSPRSFLRLSSPVVPDPRDDLCGAQCFIHVEIERGEKSWLVVLMEKLKAWQERPSRGTLKIQFSDDLGPLHDPKTITLRSSMMSMPFKGIAKFSLARAIEDANVVRDLQLSQHARLWTAVEHGPSLHDFLSSDGFKSLHKDDPSLQDVLMSDSMLDVPPSRGDRGPESEYCLEVILSGLVLPATEVHVVLRVQTGQLFEPPNCMVTREKQHLDGSVFDLLENWLEVNGPAEKSRDATVHVVSCLLNPRSTATFLPHMKFSVKVDNDDAIDLGDDVYQDLKLTEAGRPAGVIVELIYDSDQGAGAEKCLLMLCVGPKGSIARKFFDIDDALLETTQAELACRTLGAARGNLRVEDVVQHSIFRMSAHYADARAPIDRKNVASGLENHNGSSELLKGAKLTLASDTLREAMEVVPRNSRFIVCHASHAAPSRSSELFATVSVVNGRGDSILQHAGHDFSDYDADSEARVRQALEDLSVLWMGKNPSSEKHLEAAAAAGNAFAAAVVERLRAGPPSRKLARKYDLTAFGAPFLELLPRGLRDLEQVISKYPVAQRKIRGPDRALEASRNEDAPREEEAPRSKAEVDKEIEEAMDKLEDVFVDAVAPAPASKKNAKKKAKKKAKAKEAKAEETSVAARDAHGSASIAHSDSDESFKSALCETPKARSPAAPPSEPLVAPADGADSDDWVDVSAARRGKGAAKRVESSPPPPTPPPPPRVPSPPPPPSPSSPGADGLLPALKRFVETHSIDDTACILDETDAIQRALLERLEELEATAGDVGDWSAVVADFLEETRENEANERAFAEEAQGVAADRLRAEERRLEGESEALARQLDAEDRREAAARQAAAAGRGPRSWGAAPAGAAAPPPAATSAFDRVPKAELQRRVKAFVDAQKLDGKCCKALEAYAVRDADACVRFLRAAPGDLGSVDDQNAYVLSAIHGKFLLAASASELKALAPELRDIADKLALTSDVAKVLKKLSLAQQRRPAERLADPGVMFGALARNAFILAELQKQKRGCLLRDGHGASVDADLVAALDGLRLSKRCYRKLRDLNPKGQGFCALALESADLSTITDVSGYVEKGLEKGTLLRRGRELMDAAPRGAAVAAGRWRRAGARRRAASLGLGRAAQRAGAGFAVVVAPSAVPAARRRPRSDSAAVARRGAGAGPAWAAASHEPAPAPLWSREDPPGSPPPPHADVPPLFAAAATRPALACGPRRRRRPATEDLARAATAFTIADAARRGASLEAAFRDAHAACAKSCDHCKAPGSVDVLVAIHDIPKALALSVAWFTSTPEPADVEGVLRLAHEPLDGAGVFDEPKPGAKPARRLGLFAVVVFQDAHYTALVRDKRADSWTWYDRRDVTLVGSFESMVAKCRNDGGAPLCPYLLFYDAPA